MDSEIKINEQLTLKIPALKDADDIYKAVDGDRKHLGKYLKWVDNNTSVKDTEDDINKRIEGFKKGDAASFIIYYENNPIGSVGFTSLDKKNMQGEIGYWLNSSFEGKGIMTESVKGVIEYGFKTLGLHKIVIKCNSENAKSAAIPNRLGFVQEGILRDDRLSDGVYHNTLVFGLLNFE